MFAVDAGARKVYAIEWDRKNYEALRRSFALNCYSDKIVLIKGDVTKIALPEKVDVIVGEMISTGLIEELQIPAMNNLLKYAKRSVRVVLKSMENYVDLVFNNDNFHGKIMKIVRYEYPGEKTLRSLPLSEKVLYRGVDFTKTNPNVLVDSKIGLAAVRGGVINGVRLCSRTIFHDGSTFDGSFAYCYPVILPLDDMKVRKGQTLLLNVSYRMCEGFGTLKYSLLPLGAASQ